MPEKNKYTNNPAKIVLRRIVFENVFVD